MPQPLKAKLHNKTGRVKNINKTHVNTSISGTNGENTSRNTHSAASSNTRNPNQTELARSAVNENPLHDETIPSSSNGVVSDSSANEQFELELCWCIQTLEKSIELGKLSAKQTQDTLKTIRLLKSNNQPLIKKRQLMQLALGDYRKKMVEEEKRLKKGNTLIHFIDNSNKKDSAHDSKTVNSQCHFVKKSFAASLGDSNFRFKFAVDEIGKLSLGNSTDGAEASKICDKNMPVNSPNDSNLVTLPQQNHQNDSNPFVKTKLINAKSNNSFKFNFNV